jgi:2-keto-4-pentenoate hydratase/2-oxohepta-3-ene-1,7-dioic acid hydratase in catechol pathway
MRLVRFLHNGAVLEGRVEGSGIVADAKSGGRSYRPEDVKLLFPSCPTKIVCVGLNYRAHAKELDMSLPPEPVIFIKPSTAVIGPGDAIIWPENVSRVDYEAELGIVIKTTARNVPPGKVNDHILGYTCVNDVTARDLQKKDTQWTRSKSFDTFAPVGPWIETDLDVSNVRVRSYLNGALKQDASTEDLIFKVPELVSFISFVMTLLPGDIIATGTPSGVGPMRVGDEVAVEIEGIGRLVNVVKRA